MSPRTHFDFEGTDRFEIRRRIGSGGMGVVYEAYDRQLGAQVALKTLKHVDPESLYRLKNEFRSLQDVQHANLVSLGELIEEKGDWFFTMELVEGVELRSWVWNIDEADGQPADHDTLQSDRIQEVNVEIAPDYDVKRLRNAMAQLAAGVIALHESGKVHRDIKPSNILVTKDGRVVLLDFGLVADTTGSHDRTSRVRAVGTAAYMAPEQAAAKPISAESDWYSVGVMLYEALTGSLPFSGPALQVLMDKQHLEPPPPSDIRPEIPSDLNELCIELLRIEPTARPTGQRVMRRLGVEPKPRSQPSSSSSSQLTSSPPFLGREGELRRLERAFAASDTAATTVYVRGESGVGKSALVRQFVDQCLMKADPPVVLTGRCYERESVPYKAFDGVIDVLSQYLRRLPKTDAAMLLPRNVNLLAQVFPVLGRVEVVAHAPRRVQGALQPNELRARAFGALRELLGAIADHRQVIVMVDDLQWADADSLRLLQELVRPPEAPAILVIATVRSDAANEEDLALLGPVEQIEVGPLEIDAARKLARTLLRQLGVRDGSNTGWIALEARGHPMYIHELVRHLVVAGPDSPAERLRLDEAIWERVQLLEPGAIHVLTHLCVAGVPSPLGAVRDAAELEAGQFSRSVSVLRVANLVRAKGWRDIDRIEPYHDRVREAVVSHLDAETKRKCHERLAVAFELSGDAKIPPEALVLHLEASGDTHKAGERAAKAADTAMSTFAFDRAAQLYRTALRLGTMREQEARRLRMGLGDALSYVGRGPEAAAVWLEAAEGADAATRLECLQMASQEYLISGHLESGFEALEALTGEIGVSLPKTPRRALASLLWNRLRLRIRGRGWKERHAREIADAELIRFDVFRSVSAALGLVDNIRGADFQARGMLHALRIGEPLRVAYAVAIESIYLASQGGRAVEQAKTLVAEVREIADRLDDPHTTVLADLATAMSGVLNRPIPVAVADCATAQRLIIDQHAMGPSRALSLMPLRGPVRIFRCIVLRISGAQFELKSVYKEYVRSAVQRGDRYMETTLRRLCNSVYLADDNPDGARRNLKRTSWTNRELGYHLQHAVEDEARIELVLYEGTAEENFVELTDAFKAATRSLWLRVQIFRVLYNSSFARMVIAGRPNDPGLRRQAAARGRSLEDEGAGYAVVFGKLIKAGLHRDTDQAAVLWREALTAAEQHETKLCAAAARFRLGECLGGIVGAELIDAACEWMTGEGIVNPARMTDVVAPTVRGGPDAPEANTRSPDRPGMDRAP